MNDPRLGRFLSTDPLAAISPWQSPYVFAANGPIQFIEFLGLHNVEPSESKSASNGGGGGGETAQAYKNLAGALGEVAGEGAPSDSPRAGSGSSNQPKRNGKGEVMQ